LDIGGVSVELDDLSDELVIADLDELIHLGSSHALSDDN
jgi:hypothetical protein